MKEEDKPLWLAVYEAFPPKYEPRFDRQLPKKNIKNIFYKEDLIRARFLKDQDFIPAINLANESVPSATQNFLSIYKTIKEQEKLSGNETYKKAMQQYTSEVKTRMLKKVETNTDNKPFDIFK